MDFYLAALMNTDQWDLIYVPIYIVGVAPTNNKKHRYYLFSILTDPKYTLHNS